MLLLLLLLLVVSLRVGEQLQPQLGL